ncbi:Rad9-domain-containing protein [Scleroderma yunnanense]
MQATLSAPALKPFTRALTCLSRYGDDLVIHADAEYLSLSTTNSSLSAYCRFKYSTRFFSRYRVGNGVNGNQSSSGGMVNDDVKGQLLAKTLLSILKHRTIDKTVERCELSILEGLPPSEEELDEDQDSLESRLIIKLHCKHGIVKTHKLPLLIPNSLLSPGVPDSQNESHLTIGPRAIRDITEHFPGGRATKNDPQLVWTFGETEVDVKSLESSVDAKGRTQLATELTISVDEFDVYEIFSAPVTVAFHLREFNATISFAEAMGSALDLCFTDPAAPLFIGVEGDESECLFVISTSQIHGASTNRQGPTANLQADPRVTARKRTHLDAPEEDQQTSTGSGSRQQSETPHRDKVRKSMKAALRIDAIPDAASHSSVNTSQAGSRVDSDFDSVPPPSSVLGRTQALRQPFDDFHSILKPAEDFGHVGGLDFDVDMGVDRIFSGVDDRNSREKRAEPLFYPGSSQIALPQSDAGPSGASHPLRTLRFYPEKEKRDLEQRTPKDIPQEEQEVVDFSALTQGGEGRSSLELFEDEFGPTQEGDREGRKAFQPLFED